MEQQSQIRWRTFVCFLLGIFLLRGIVLACVLPPLEMWDEYQHLAYIECIVRTDRPPVFEITRIDPTLLRRVVQLPASPSEWLQLSRFGVLTYDQYWNRLSSGPVAPPMIQLPLIYEAQHPPLYYWLVTPVYRRFAGDLPQAISMLRLLNVGFTAIGLGAILIWLGKICRDRKQAALLGLCVVTQPLFLLNADRVANDALAVMLGSLAIVWAMSLTPRFIRLQSLGLGLLIGLGVMTKATDLVILPFAIVCLLLLAFRKQDRIARRSCVESCILLVVGTAIITGHYISWSLHRYGTITPMQEAVMNREAHTRFADFLRYAPITVQRIRDWRIMVQHWIIGDGLWVGGWTRLQPPRWLTAVYEMLFVLSGFTWILSRVLRKFRMSESANPFTKPLVGTRILILCLLMLLAMSYHSIQSMVAWNGSSATTPWYASLVVPWLLIGLFSGPSIFRRSLIGGYAALVPALACLLFLGTETYGVFFQMVPRYSCLPFSTAAFTRLSTLHPFWLNDITLSLATAAELSLVALAVCFMVRGSSAIHTPENPSE